MDYSHEIKKVLGEPIRIHNDKTMLYNKIYVDIIKKYNIINWEGNRSPDTTRFPEIKHLGHRQNYIDGTVYLAYFDSNTLVCYDGMHRLSALSQLYDETNDLFHSITLNILPRYDVEFIERKIKEINKCQPIVLVKIDIRTKIYNISDTFKEKYNKMFSDSKNPRIPNTSRDDFANKLHDIIKTLNLKNISETKILNLIENFNIYIKAGLSQLNLSDKQKKKCKDNNCYMFAIRGWEHKLIDFYEKKYITMD